MTEIIQDIIPTGIEPVYVEVPKHFEGTSKIVAIEKTDTREGIVLDTLDEVANVLYVYAGDSVKSARGTKEELVRERYQEYDGLVGELFEEHGKMNARGYTEKVIADVKYGLSKFGCFNRNYGYSGNGTNFFDTVVNVRPNNGKYLLEIYNNPEGREPERELAKILGKPLALVDSRLIGIMSRVNDLWVYFKLDTLLKGLPVTKKQFKDYSRFLVDRDSYEKPEVIFSHEGNNFDMEIGWQFWDRESYPIGYLSRTPEHSEMKGNSIVAGVWTTYNQRTGKKSAPRPLEPRILFGVSLPKEWSSDRSCYKISNAVTQAQVQQLQDARDYIAEIVQQNIK